MKQIILMNLMLFAFAISHLVCTSKKEMTEKAIFPKPEKQSFQEEFLKIENSIKVFYSSKLESVAQLASQKLKSFGLQPQLELSDNFSHKGGILLCLSDSIEGDEAYKLSVSGNGIKIQGKTGAGVFYGLQTLYQLLPLQNEAPSIKFTEISDSPRFAWRGMHLDVARHFFTKEEVKKYIDYLAAYKLNVFHIHLTDDQAWRIEIKKYPLLTNLGGFRVDKTKEKWDYDQEVTNRKDVKLYGGFYTQDDIKELIQYAQERFITIVPEIEMPGHGQAAMTAYPHLACSGKPYRRPSNLVFDFTDPFCAGNDSVFSFFEDVLTEVMALFPSKYIHIGGDEAKKTPWETCPKCKKRAMVEKLKNVGELQSYFIKRIEKFVSSKGRNIIGWDEILEGGLAPGASVMSWRGEEGAIEAAKENHKVVMANSTYLYFDEIQYSIDIEGTGINELVNLEKIYGYDPLPKSIAEKNSGLLLGAEGCLWTENTQTMSKIEERLFPRLVALSEILWTKEKNKNFTEFSNRLTLHYPYLDLMNVQYFITPPTGPRGKEIFEKDYNLKLKNLMQYGKIHYTLDQTDPTSSSPVFADSLLISKTSKIKARIILPSGKMSAVCEFEFEQKTAIEPTAPNFALSQGLNFSYFEGKYKSLNDFSTQKAVKTGSLSDIVFPAFVQKDFWGIVYDGFIKIEEAGIYTFFTQSDDGSRIELNGNLLVENDSIHGIVEKYGQVILRKGYYPIKISYFEGNYGESLEVFMQKDKAAKVKIPAAILFRKAE